MTCQAIDYSHFHTYGGCAPCAGVDGKVGAHQTLQLTVGGKQCPKKSRAGETCPVTNINDIGVDCYETDGGSGYVLKQKIPTKTKLIWTFGEFNQIS